MNDANAGFALHLAGPFRLVGPDGARITLSSKRGQALIAMLATSGSGERTRVWLQDQLWGSRSPDQASSSLRRELSNLRKATSVGGKDLFDTDFRRIKINLDLCWVDVRSSDTVLKGAFLEGLDVAGEDGFEDWLREERAQLAARQQISPAVIIPETKSAPLERKEFTERPAIAILPFRSDQSDERQTLIAEGVAEDLLDRLSRLRWLPVIARATSFSLVDRTTDPSRIGTQLGARYILDGLVKSRSSGFQILVKLIDCETQLVMWSDTVELSDALTPEVFEPILSGVAAALGYQIDHLEQRRALGKASSDLNFSDLIWKGRWHMHKLGKDDIALAKRYFNEALEREPHSAEALVHLAWVEVWTLWLTRGSEEQHRAARKMAQRAILADYEDARGHMLAGIIESWLRQPLRAEALLQRAIELNPSLVLAHAQLGSALGLKGDHEGALKSLNFAIRLSPNDYHLFFILGERAITHFMKGDFDLAVDDAENALSRRHAYFYAHVIKINALLGLGKNDDARAAYLDFQASVPDFKIDYLDWVPFIERSWIEKLKAGLNQAAR